MALYGAYCPRSCRVYTDETAAKVKRRRRRPLGVANLGIDPMIGEKFSGNLPKFRIERFKGIENDLLCLTIGERAASLPTGAY